jgi:hypothetical protein
MMKKFMILALLLCAAPVFAGGPAALTATAAETVFPVLEAQALDDSIVTLPGAVKNKVSLIILTFSRPGDKDLDSWVKPFEDNFNDNSRTAHYEIAMIGDIGFINGFILSGMKGGASDPQKKHLLVLFRDKGPYKKYLNITDDSLIYVYLLDQKGIIRLVKTGKRALAADNDEINSLASSFLRPLKNQESHK